MLQRRHYKIIAEILHKIHSDLGFTNLFFEDIFEFFIVEFEKDNPNFNADKFRNAVYGDE